MEQNYVTVTLCRCLLFRITVGVVRVTVWVKCRVMLSWSLRKNEETRLEAFEIKGVNRFCGFRGQQRKQMSGFLTSRSKEGTDRHRQSKEASIHQEETRELPGERDNARNNARCTQARKTTHGLDGRHHDVDRTLRGRVNQNDRGQG